MSFSLSEYTKIDVGWGRTMGRVREGKMRELGRTASCLLGIDAPAHTTNYVRCVINLCVGKCTSHLAACFEWMSE